MTRTTKATVNANQRKVMMRLRESRDDYLAPHTIFEKGRTHELPKHYAKHAEDFLAPEHLTSNSGEATVQSTPLGVTLGVEPWNFPYYQLVRFVISYDQVNRVIDDPRIKGWH